MDEAIIQKKFKKHFILSYYPFVINFNFFYIYNVLGCLQIKTPLPVNEGYYTLVASNSFGKVKRNIFAQFDEG